jgi:DNA-binding winged helix-turn-helix (wHTH) protein/predicted ATPase
MILHFDCFRFDGPNRQLLGDAGAIRLNPKAFDVLLALIERAGEFVSKDELLDRVWPGTHVADGVLKVCVAEIRRALGDSPTAPRFIETVHRRGYRFVATTTVVHADETRPARADAAPLRTRSLLAWPPGSAVDRPAALVGRSRELDLLAERLGRALDGERRVVFVTGEPGAGKTALVEYFVVGAARGRTLAITGSQCLEQFGSAEAYMPVLEAIGRLVRADGTVSAPLRRYAPTWFAQLPWLIEEHDRERLGRELLGATRERMLREMAEFVEALSGEIPLVLVIEDLHWCDPSTVDLLSLIAVRREPARLLVLATYRPVDLILARHALREVARRLAAGRRCPVIALDELPVEAVAEYLRQRFAQSRFPPDLAALLRERTGGNSLFLVTLVDHLVSRGAIVARDQQWTVTDDFRRELADVPESLRLVIEQELDRLDVEDRRLLESASVAGVEFASVLAAVGAECSAAEAEDRCARLADAGRFVRTAGRATWPDGTAVGRFAFRHPLYREALAGAMPRHRREHLHLRIGEVLERVFGERSSDLAAELAVHFQEGGDPARAARYRRAAAQTAATRHAFAEAQAHLEQGLALLTDVVPSSDRDRLELSLQSALGAVLTTTRGYAAPEVEHAYTRALELWSRSPQEASAFPELFGHYVLHITRGQLDSALVIAERIQTIADAGGDRLMRLQAHHALWIVHYVRGDFAQALQHIDQGEPLYDPDADRMSALVYLHDARASALSVRSLLLWNFGHIDQALEVNRRSVEYARTLGHPVSFAYVLVHAGWLRALRREPEACATEAEAVIAYAMEHELEYCIARGLLLRGWALAERGLLDDGIADMERGLATLAALGTHIGQTTYLAQLVSAMVRAGRFDDARALIERTKTLVASTAERYYEAEIHRLDAELVVAEAGGADGAPSVARARATELLETAIECATRQNAVTLALRATTALARVHARGTPGAQARARLATLLATFTEGFDTADVQDARRLAAGRARTRRSAKAEEKPS